MVRVHRHVSFCTPRAVVSACWSEADGDPTSLAVETFFTALCDACPSLLLWCLLRQLNELITRCVGEAQDSGSTAATSTSLGSSASLLLNIPLLDLAERASRLTHLTELALLAESRTQGDASAKSASGQRSTPPARSASATSTSVSASGSAFTLLLTSFGLHWRDIWAARFIGGNRSHEDSSNEGTASGMRAAASSSISSDSHCPGPSSASATSIGWLCTPRLSVHLPMLQTALWQLLGRMTSRQQADDIAQMAQS